MDSELGLGRSFSNSYMRKSFPVWRNRLTSLTWRMVLMNRLCLILKGSWNWMIWNKLHKITQKNPNQLATTAKIQVTIETSAINSTGRKTKFKTTRIVPAITTTLPVVRKILTATKRSPTIPTKTKPTNKKTENLDPSIHPVRPAAKLTIPLGIVSLEQTQFKHHLPEQTTGRAKTGLTKKRSKQFRCECSGCSPNFKVETPRFHSGAACDRRETIQTSKLPPIFEVVW